ncbi:MAG: putative RND superfamily exporter protein, partial [Myxococcota bacterium]
MLYRITSGLIARRGIALGVLLAITAGLGVFAARVGIDNNVGVWFVEGDPTLASYQRFQDTFGNDEVVAIAAVTDRKGGVWTSEYLNKIRTLTARLEKVEGVSRVLSVSNAQLLGLHSDGEGGQALGVAPVMPGEVVDADLARLRTLVETDPILKDTFVVSEGRVAMVFAQMAVADKFDSVRPGVLTGIQDVLDDSGLTTHVAGIGVIYNALNQIAQVEGAVFMGLAFLLVFALLWPLFRSVPAVLASIGAVACAVVMTRGLYGLAGRDENMVTMTLPVLVLILGVADCVHIFRYRASRPDEDPARVLADILKPCIFTTLTTMVGFAALATSKMALVRDLGIFAAAGIGLAVVSSTVMAAFVMGRPGFRVKPPSKPGEGLMGRFLAWTARFAVGNKETVLGITCLVILLAGYGISLIQVDTYSLGYLDESHPVRAASEAMEKAAGPFTPLEILVRGEKSEAIV